MSNNNLKRLKINITGIVQGVGFRPFIYNHARSCNLTGFVKNTQQGVEIEAEGSPADLNKFLDELPDKAPALSEIIEITDTEIDTAGSDEFVIDTSAKVLGNETLISPDVSICDDCRDELFDNNDRRWLYPFINCTNCGPRFTIIEDIPYDREYTTMKEFEMCPDCRAEYEDPADRRFHAQPNACPVCGPQVWLENNSGEKTAGKDDAFLQCCRVLADGGVAAVKGLGGFHIAADAANEEAVVRLRERKGREAKPFAIMVETIEEAEKLAEISKEEKKILMSPQRPILLLKRKENDSVAPSTAPDNKRLGVMLPYTPVHYLLFHTLKKKVPGNENPVLIMTSANFSEEPIEISNESARKRLAPLADVFLMHNREILIRSDDSVGFYANDELRMMRRSRGYVPRPLLQKKKYPAVMGAGAELKNTVTLIKDEKIFTSQHIGDLTNRQAYDFFKLTIEHLQKIMNRKAEYFVRDLHPSYLSSQWVDAEADKPVFKVQHHHAHMAACMAEHRLDEPVLSLVLDGTGLGYDKTIWGGEVLAGDYTGITRYAHIEKFPLPGGDAAAREPWRAALAYLYHTFGSEFPHLPFLEGKQYKPIIQMIDKNFNTPYTSSTGRFFDAVSALSGGPQKIRYEAEAAIRFMHTFDEAAEGAYYTQDPLNEESGEIRIKPVIKAAANDAEAGASMGTISAKYHRGLAQLFADVLLYFNKKTGLNKIVLSGGVFQNEILITLLENLLRKKELEVFSHLKLPGNDACISTGQAVIAAELILKKMDEVSFRSMV